MAEEKKGHVKVTMEVEINEALMEVVKEAIKNMPQMAHTWQKMREQ
jgi:ferredoxin